MKRRYAPLFLLLSAAACGAGEDEPLPTADERRDVRALLGVVAEDPARPSLREVDEAVAEDLPVEAASLLEAGAIPAAHRAAQSARELELETAVGRRLQRDLVAALEARASALEGYARVLSRGLVEDMALVEALRAQREAQEAIDAVITDLREAEGVPSGASPPQERSAD